MSDECQATPKAELERQIMDPNVPKNEREWWAAAEVERLQGLLTAKTTPGYELLAGTIEKMEAEIARLRADLAEAEKYNGHHQQACVEIERLRDKTKNRPPAGEG